MLCNKYCPYCQYCAFEIVHVVLYILSIFAKVIVNIVNIVRLSSGEKLGVLSQGPTIVYDVKMVGLKVALEMQNM